jgi:hypothetical protein
LIKVKFSYGSLNRTITSITYWWCNKTKYKKTATISDGHEITRCTWSCSTRIKTSITCCSCIDCCRILSCIPTSISSAAAKSRYCRRCYYRTSLTLKSNPYRIDRKWQCIVAISNWCSIWSLPCSICISCIIYTLIWNWTGCRIPCIWCWWT